MRIYLSLIVLSLSFFSINAQIINKGNLKIQPGTVVYFGDNYTNDNTGNHINDGDLHLNGDFTNNGIVTVTAAANGTTFFDSSTTNTQNLNGSTKEVIFNNLSINNSATNGESLAVADEYNLEVTNNLHIEDNQKLRLMGESQLIQKHAGGTSNSGGGHLLTDQQGAKNAYRYNYWSAPVQNDSGTIYGLSTILKDGTTPNEWSPTQVNFTTASNGFLGDPITLSTRWMYKYVDSTVDPYNSEDWIALFDSTPSEVNTMSPAEGYIMKGTDVNATHDDLQNYSFEGKPNDGDYTLQINNGKEYLVGNPYPSALDANTFLADNNGNIDGTIWFWEHWSTDTHVYTDYGGGYIVYTPGSGATQATLHEDYESGANAGTSGVVGALPDNYKIPVGQGFLVRSTSISTGSATNIVFKNSQRVFYPKNATDNSSVLVKTVSPQRVRIGYEGPNQRHRFLLLAFTQEGTDSYENNYDAEMIDLGSNDLYFTMEDEGRNLPYVIQGVGQFDEENSYPITLKVETSGEHHIMIDALEDFDEDIYILDKESNTTFRINDEAFVIYLNEGTYSDRFEIVFQPQSSLEVNNYLNNIIDAFYTDNEIVIRKNDTVHLTNIQVFNNLGQLVFIPNNTSQFTQNEIRLPFNFSQGTYYIKVTAKEGKGNFKFIKH